MTPHNEKESLASLGVLLPEILIPNGKTDIPAWAVVACDQYTSEPEYWRRVAEITEGRPSTYHCVFPESFLGKEGAQERILSIRRAMTQYLTGGYLRALPPGLVLVDRRTPYRESRKGMVLALDLEKYDFSRESRSLIRPTEGTILERLPPRVKIRRKAPLEFPHILILIDDPEGTVVEPLFAKNAAKPLLYDTDLMTDAGHVTGRFVPAEEAADHLAESLAGLIRPGKLRERYGTEAPLLFAVGDGNHSLATAKTVWEEIKAELTPAETASHPARYALVEIVNLFDPGIVFEPIHRLLSGVDVSDFLEYLQGVKGLSLTPAGSFASAAELAAADEADSGAAGGIGLFSRERSALLRFSAGTDLPAAGAVDRLLEAYLRTGRGGSVDYIHGEETLLALSGKPDAVGFLLPALPKERLFPTIVKNGALPRKAFSIGEAPEKRFYLEGRKIDGGHRL